MEKFEAETKITMKYSGGFGEKIKLSTKTARLDCMLETFESFLLAIGFHKETIREFVADRFDLEIPEEKEVVDEDT
jgi:hypothetical protein